MKRGILASCMVILSLVMGCATATNIAVSSPPVQTGGNEYYEARLEPLKSSGNFFDSFRLTVANKTDGNL
ncbi:MAG TPA: hypothetical protein VEI96_00710, partial [Thermodesulfovibrionales bacterium]|nr:hypothetical protein [Thermodesulfovibrionales bacterium]